MIGFLVMIVVTVLVAVALVAPMLSRRFSIDETRRAGSGRGDARGGEVEPSNREDLGAD